MKNVLKILFASAFLLMAMAGYAQKVGHISMPELIQAMPETVTVNKELEAFGKVLKDELETMQVDLKNKTIALENGRATMAADVAEAKWKEIQELSQKFETRQTEAEQEFRKKQDDLFKPIMEKANAAINKVAKANGVVSVLDANPRVGVVLYADETNGFSLLPLVKKELGIVK